MKSRLLTALFDDPESGAAKKFARDLADALQLAEADREACLVMLPKFHLAQTIDEKKQLFEQLASDRQIERGRLQHALAVMDYLLRAFLNDELPDSDWLAWADDLADLNYIDTSTRPVFEAMVAAIKSELVSEVEPERRRRRAAQGVLPVFIGCGITVEVRSVSEHSYRRGSPIEEYEPRVVDTATVASIAIKLDEGPFKDVYFQADESDIDFLINSLEAARKEITALRGFLKLEA